MHLWKNTRSVEESRRLARASWAGREHQHRDHVCIVTTFHAIMASPHWWKWALLSTVCAAGGSLTAQGLFWLCGIQEWQHSQQCGGRIWHCRQRGWIPSELPSRAALLATSSSSTNSCHCNLLVKNRQNAFSSNKKILFPSLFFLKGLVDKYQRPLQCK